MKRKTQPAADMAAELTAILAAFNKADRSSSRGSEIRTDKLSDSIEFQKIKMSVCVPKTIDDAAALVCVVSGDCDLIGEGLLTDIARKEHVLRVEHALYNLRTFLERQGATVTREINDYFMRKQLDPNGMIGKR